MYAFKDMGEKFIIENNKVCVIAGENRIELKGISYEILPTTFD